MEEQKENDKCVTVFESHSIVKYVYRRTKIKEEKLRGYPFLPYITFA
jgi:hypothetical protein